MSRFHMSHEQAMHFPLLKALALSAWHTENGQWPMRRTTDGYLTQEVKRRQQEKK